MDHKVHDQVCGSPDLVGRNQVLQISRAMALWCQAVLCSSETRMSSASETAAADLTGAILIVESDLFCEQHLSIFWWVEAPSVNPLSCSDGSSASVRFRSFAAG